MVFGWYLAGTCSVLEYNLCGIWMISEWLFGLRYSFVTLLLSADSDPAYSEQLGLRSRNIQYRNFRTYFALEGGLGIR